MVGTQLKHDNKREIVRDSWGKFIGTKPYHFIDGYIVERVSYIIFFI